MSKAVGKRGRVYTTTEERREFPRKCTAHSGYPRVPQGWATPSAPVCAASLKCQSGLGLLESILTLLLLSWGLLSVAYTGIWALSHEKDAQSRLQAGLAANDLIDSIRSLNIVIGSEQARILTSTATPGADCDDLKAGVENLRNCFFERLAEHIPVSAASIVEFPALDPDGFRIRIAWADRTASHSADAPGPPTTADCINRARLASGVDNGLIWFPANSKPTTNTCLEYITWVATP